MKKRIFFDMDGTLCEWNNDASLEEITKPGYFKNRTPITSSVNTIKTLLKRKDFEVYILSSVFQDDHSIQDKDYWLDNNGLEEIDKEHRLYCPYGEDKSEFIKNTIGCNEFDFLLDDYTNNLFTWHGIGIKVYNSINGTKKRWRGYSIRSNCYPEVFTRTLLGIVQYALD